MPRRSTPFLAGQHYHFYNRGNNRQAVFFEPENYLYFLRGIKRYLRPEVDVLAYCLMPTHYHLLVRIKASEILEQSEVSSSLRVSRAMQKFGISYTKAMNRRFSRVGALFQGQFRGKPVNDYEHLLQLCIYIHANPVKSGLAFTPEEWEYSNCPEWMGQRDGTLVDREFVRDNFGTPAEYSRVVMNYIAARELPGAVQRYLDELES
jgi:REP element-mobilizing transposase RayT